MNPDNQPATWEQVKYWRDLHEVAPVNTSFGLFDADSRSDLRMANSISQFAELPTVVEGKLPWKRADNTYVLLSCTELEQVFEEVKKFRSIRGALLHEKAEQLRVHEPYPTPNQLKSIDFWLN